MTTTNTMTLKEFAHAICGIFNVDTSNTYAVKWDGTILTVRQMYDFIDCDFGTLQQLAALMGTQKINLGDQGKFGGCETCDHGSRYEQEFHITGATLKVEG